MIKNRYHRLSPVGFEVIGKKRKKGKKDKNELANGEAIEFHFSLGMWIRNNWIYEQNEEDITRLAKAFRMDYIVFDPDGLSGKIIEYYQRYLKRKGL